MSILLSVFEGRIHFDCENRKNSARRQRDRVETPGKGPLNNTVRTPTAELFGELYGIVPVAYKCKITVWNDTAGPRW